MLNARPVTGRYRRLRWAANVVLIAILVAIPWIRVGGEPLVLLDIPAREFHVFGLVIFPQELYFLWLLLAGLALALFFFTALAGRLWCGWACPQTVFTDVYAAIARRIQGWTRSGPPRHVAAWRRVATHAVWAVLSVLVAFHLVGYFRSPYELLPDLLDGGITGAAGAFWGATAVLTFLDFVIVRQTFCKYVCPYARFQSVLFDRDTLVVAYDPRRGEPRGKKGKARGDCVDCGLCVAVCPTGIDIRDGLQLECIACTQCIDACDSVMERIGRPRGLIDYRSLASLEGRPTRLLRPRVVIYGALLACVGIAFGVLLERRMPLDLQVHHLGQAYYRATADGRIANTYDVRIQNRDRAEHVYRLRLEAPEGFELVAGLNPVRVAPLSTLETRAFVVVPPERVRPGLPVPLRFVLEELGSEARAVVRPATFVAPRGADGTGARGGPQEAGAGG